MGSIDESFYDIIGGGRAVIIIANPEFGKGSHPAAAPQMMVQDNMALYEFDGGMVHVSLGLAQDLMVDPVISNVKVTKTRIGYATIRNDRHHGISAELLAQRKNGPEGNSVSNHATDQEIPH